MEVESIFADHARGIQSTETGEIDRRFRMASPFQYAIPAGTNREHVARPCQIGTNSRASALSPVMVRQISPRARGRPICNRQAISDLLTPRYVVSDFR